jgi:DNA-binding IclR family transcriptional regulator
MSEQIGTVARALSVLRVIAEAKAQVGVKEVSDALALPMSTSHRLLDLLAEAGFVEKEKIRRRYGVGSEFFRLANLVTQKVSIPSLVQPLLNELTAKTGETALYTSYLSAHHTAAYAAKCDSPHSLRFRISLHVEMPLEWGATGLAILAFLPEDVQGDVFARARPSPVSGRKLAREAFFKRIATVRRDGFAVTEGEKLPDSIGIAAPLETIPGSVVGSIALTIPKIRFERAKARYYGDLVRRAAAAFSAPPPAQKTARR